MTGKVHFPSAFVGLAVFAGAFFAALAWFSDETTGEGIGVVALNLVGGSGGLKVPVFIVVVLLVILVAVITIFNSRDKLLRQSLRSIEEEHALLQFQSMRVCRREHRAIHRLQPSSVANQTSTRIAALGLTLSAIAAAITVPLLVLTGGTSRSGRRPRLVSRIRSRAGTGAAGS